MDPSDYPPLLNVIQAAEILGLGRNTVYRYVRSGELPSIRVGRLIRIPRDRLLRQVGLLDEEWADKSHLPSAEESREFFERLDREGRRAVSGADFILGPKEDEDEG